MECSTRWGVVQQVSSFPNRQELLVQVGTETAKALAFPKLTGECRQGNGCCSTPPPSSLSWAQEAGTTFSPWKGGNVVFLLGLDTS